MAKIKTGIDRDFLRRVAKEEMEKALDKNHGVAMKDIETHPLGNKTLIGSWGSYFMNPSKIGALVVDGYNNEVRVADSGNYPAHANAARYALKRLEELGLVE